MQKTEQLLQQLAEARMMYLSGRFVIRSSPDFYDHLRLEAAPGHNHFKQVDGEETFAGQRIIVDDQPANTGPDFTLHMLP